MSISVTPIPRLTTFATPAFTLGVSNIAGDTAAAVASNATLLAFDATVPTTISASDTAAAGSQAISARRDHEHGSGAFTLAVSGSYTGDGAASLAITGLGITPQFLMICKRSTGGGAGVAAVTWSSMVDDNAAGMAYRFAAGSTHGATVTDQVRSMESGGFTVGDTATQGSINSDTSVYNYFAIGA
jgi:hypothetical protein